MRFISPRGIPSAALVLYSPFIVDADRNDAVFLVVFQLLGAAAIRLINSALHRIGDAVGVHDDAFVDVRRGPPIRLDESRARAQEASLVRVWNRDQGNHGQVESFAQKIDADYNVEDAEAQSLLPFSGMGQ